jgi:hypothetical protein
MNLLFHSTSPQLSTLTAPCARQLNRRALLLPVPVVRTASLASVKLESIVPHPHRARVVLVNLAQQQDNWYDHLDNDNKKQEASGKLSTHPRTIVVVTVGVVHVADGKESNVRVISQVVFPFGPLVCCHFCLGAVPLGALLVVYLYQDLSARTYEVDYVIICGPNSHTPGLVRQKMDALASLRLSVDTTIVLLSDVLSSALKLL